MDQILKAQVPRKSSPIHRASARGTVMVLCAALMAGFLLAAFKGRWGALGVFPDLVLLCAVWLALRCELWAAALGAFILGFFLDGLTLAPSGAVPLSLEIAVLLVALLSRVLELSGSIYIMCLIFFIFSLSNLAIYPLLIYIGYGNRPFDAMSHYFSIYCIQGILTAAAGPPLFWILDRLTAREV